MSAAGPDDLEGFRARTRALCAQFPDEHWRETDRWRRYPQEFVDTLTAAGLLAALIPAAFGGLGAMLTQAAVIRGDAQEADGRPGPGRRGGSSIRLEEYPAVRWFRTWFRMYVMSASVCVVHQTGGGPA